MNKKEGRTVIIDLLDGYKYIIRCIAVHAYRCHINMNVHVYLKKSIFLLLLHVILPSL